MTLARLAIEPSPARLVVRPFDTLSDSAKKLLVLPDNLITGRNTTGIIVTTHRGQQSIMVEADPPASAVSMQPQPGAIIEGQQLVWERMLPTEIYWLNVGDQVVFAAMSGTEIQLPEPTEEFPRRQQMYIIIQERDVIAKIRSAAPITDVSANPRAYVAS